MHQYKTPKDKVICLTNCCNLILRALVTLSTKTRHNNSNNSKATNNDKSVAEETSKQLDDNLPNETDQTLDSDSSNEVTPETNKGDGSESSDQDEVQELPPPTKVSSGADDFMPNLIYCILQNGLIFTLFMKLLFFCSNIGCYFCDTYFLKTRGDLLVSCGNIEVN